MPQIPSAEWIEAAADQVANMDQSVIQDQSSELRAAVGGVSMEMVKGYNLGLQVARVIIATSVRVQQLGIDPDSIL